MERRDGHALGRCAGGGVDDGRVLGAGAAGPQARHRSDGGDEIGSGAGVGGGHAAAAGEAGEIDALGVDAALSGELLDDCGQEGDVVASAPGRGLSGDGGSARNAPRPVPVRQRTAGVHGGGGRRPRHDETGLVGVGDGVQLGDAGLEDAVRIRVVQVHDQGQRGLGVGRLGNVHLHGVGGSVEVDVDALSAAERAAALRRGRGGLRGRGVVRLRGRGSGAWRRVGAGCERRGARGCALQERRGRQERDDDGEGESSDEEGTTRHGPPCPPGLLATAREWAGDGSFGTACRSADRPRGTRNYNDAVSGW